MDTLSFVGIQVLAESAHALGRIVYQEEDGEEAVLTSPVVYQRSGRVVGKDVEGPLVGSCTALWLHGQLDRLLAQVDADRVRVAEEEHARV